MAIQGSGRILLSDLAAEFGDTKPYRISEFYRDAGKVPSVNTGVPASGFIKLGNFYNSVNELLQTVTAQASINAQTIFGADWGTNVPKRLRIPAGTTIGPLTIPTGMGGTLEVDVEGEVQGLGGSANGGSGGHAITANQSFTLNVLSGGAVRGGGGGGGLGGTGGGGQYTQAAGGWDTRNYNNGTYALVSTFQNGAAVAVYWGGYQGQGTWNSSTQMFPFGGYEYSTGPGGEPQGAQSASGVKRRTPEQTINTSGGTGGNGGVGQGYGQSLAGGSSGSAGGTNAGTGGTGGSGGNWGSAGNTGATGASGNAGGGVAGSAGGAAGRAVQMNSGTLTTNNSGTINGAY